jgi:ERCC4-type nuclease
MPGAWDDYFTVPSRRETLRTGDYTLAQFEHRIGIERKTVNDLAKSLSHQRDRFTDELARAQGFEQFFVIIEGNVSDLLAGKYYSKVSGDVLFDRICTLSVRYGVPFIWAGSKQIAAKMCENILSRYLREQFMAYETYVGRYGK